MTIIAALARKNVIGKNGELPWRLPEDLRHFKSLTTGHVVIMGRKTWESIPEKFRPLTHRTNVIVTRQTSYPTPTEVTVYASLDAALQAHAKEDIFVIGGGEIYRQSLPYAERLEITHVDREVDGDVFFPEIDPTIWHEVARESHEGFSFVTYERLTHSH